MAYQTTNTTCGITLVDGPGLNIRCLDCRLDPNDDDVLFSGPEEALKHAREHLDAGDHIPDRVFKALEEEIAKRSS